MDEDVLLVILQLSDEDVGTKAEADSIVVLCDELEEAIEAHQVGDFDGEEFGNGECALFMTGPDADALFAAVEPILRGSDLALGARVIKRYDEDKERSPGEVHLTL